MIFFLYLQFNSLFVLHLPLATREKCSLNWNNLKKRPSFDSAPLKQRAKEDDSLVAKITLQSSFNNLYIGAITHTFKNCSNMP